MAAICYVVLILYIYMCVNIMYVLIFSGVIYGVMVYNPFPLTA